MLIITTQNPEFGKGFFTGFNKEGFPCFQSCFDKRVKDYKAARNARKQLARIQKMPVAFEDKATYDIESVLKYISAPTERREGAAV